MKESHTPSYYFTYFLKEHCALIIVTCNTDFRLYFNHCGEKRGHYKLDVNLQTNKSSYNLF